MKKININFLFFAAIIFSLSMSSCSKEGENTPEITDSIVGIWDVSQGGATAYIDGTAIDVDILTSGSIEFKSDGSGISNFTMSVFDTEEEASGPFTWEKDGFELIMTSDGESLRWALIDDENSYKTIQYTEQMDGGEIEFTLRLEKK